MSKITYDTMMTANVEADVYGGENCDEVTNHFMMFCEGDMDADSSTEDIVITLKDLPAGARVLVQYPCCPDCGMARNDTFETLEGCRMQIIGHDSKCDCGFDWDNWIQEEYA